MRTKTFIEKQAGLIRDGGRGRGRCASVFAEGDTIYSYGYHYPLLFKVTTPSGKDLMVLNRLGYSNTTSKHIGWCWDKHDASCELQIHLGHDYKAVITSLLAELARIRAEQATKKRTNTYVYDQLLRREARVNEALTKLEYGF